MRLTLIFLFLLLVTGIFGQIRIDIDVHARVDTSIPEVKSILYLYKNYLLNHPDSIQQNNPYWCAEDKKKYADFDFTRGFIYGQLPMEYLCTMYRFVILSIEKESENYAIRTAIIAKDVSQPYMRQQNPWAITRVYAIKVNGVWKLKNAFYIKTKNWNTFKEGNIIYHYPADISLDKNELRKSTSFCDSIANFLNVRSWNQFDYYITESPDRLSEILGFDFALVAHTSGMAFKKDMLLNGTGSAFYPHEFVHHVAEEKNIQHELISEGLATWLGGSRLKSFQQNLTELSNALKINDTLTVDEVLDKKWGWTVGAYYTSGGLFCKLVYEKEGLNGLNQLFAIPPADDIKLRHELTVLLKTKDLNSLWKKEMAKYR